MSTELENNLRYILKEKSEKLIPENIKKDVSIFGVEGSYEPEIKLQNKNVSITENGTQTISADNGYDGLQEVDITVNVGGVYNATIDPKSTDNSSSIIAQILSIPFAIDISNRDNANNLFSGAQKITSIYSITGIAGKNDCQSMFCDCHSLQALPDLDLSDARWVNNIFKNCRSLTYIPQLNTSNVTDMQGMFFGCSSITSIPLLNTSKAKNTSEMFRGCTNLESVPLLDIGLSTNVSNMFNSCSTLTSIPQLNTSSAETMGGMFYNCTNLTTLPQLNTSSAETIGRMFSNCVSLTDESLNNVLAMCINATSYKGTKTLKSVGLSQSQAETCMTLSNYQAFLDAGWTTGY